jgi:uncharacterized membrane protein HdeD (DUF308 family)
MSLTSTAVPDTLGLAEQWWAFAVRGSFAILFALAVWAAPHSLSGLAYLFGVYAFVDGVFAEVASLRKSGALPRRWGMLAVHGATGIVAGAVAIFLPRIEAFELLFLVAGWAIMTGIAQIGTAIRLRQEGHGEWMMSLSGALAVGFGLLLVFFPGAGALARTLWLGAYALVLGGLAIVIAIRLRADRFRHRNDPGSIPVI